MTFYYTNSLTKDFIDSLSLQQIAINIFRLVYLDFGKLQNNTFIYWKVFQDINDCKKKQTQHVGPLNGRQYECEHACAV